MRTRKAFYNVTITMTYQMISIICGLITPRLILRTFGSTYNGNFPAFRIDYILFDDNFKALSYKRITSDISDHYPIVATFSSIKN